MFAGELLELTAGELYDVSSGELSTSSDVLAVEYGSVIEVATPRWYSPDRDDPKRRHFNDREPMDRRAIRYGARCLVCETLNYWTHGDAHAANDEIPCTTCGTMLPKDVVRHAREGRMNPLNAR